MASPTRLEIKRRIRASPTHRVGTPLYEDVDEYLNEDIQNVVDQIAERVWGYAPEFSFDLVADQETYCAPQYFDLKSAVIQNENGDWRPLFVDGVPMADRQTGVYWRNRESTDPPLQAFYRGFNQIVLSPPPSVSRTGAVRFEGFAKPGIYWSYDPDTGAGEAITDSSSPPLADWACDVDVIANGVIAVRCERWADTPEGIKHGYEKAALRHQARFDDQVRRIWRHGVEYRQRVAQGGVVHRYTMSRQ